VNDNVANNSILGISLSSEGKNVLDRPRLNALLEEAMGYSVVLVTAGEGYGKTHAVNSFLRQNNQAAVWIQLSERDNDPWHFWESVIKAQQNRHLRKAMEEIGFPESQGQMNRFFSILREELSDNQKHIVVADDCHLIERDAIINFCLRILASHFPQTTFILISRIESGFNTMPLLSKGLLSHISAGDLRFNEEEIADYFLLRKVNLSVEELNEINDDTEGWILALSLIADEMKSGKKEYSRRLLEGGSFRVMEEKLFASVPVSLQRFFIVLSLFDQWPSEAMEKIAAAMPEKLPPMDELTGSMKNLSSLIYYDAYLHGFRIHHVFLDFLREKQNELTSEEIKTACSIKAQWCMENDLRIDAALNYEMAGDCGGIIKAVYSFARLFSRSAAASILNIIDRILASPARNEEDENFLFLRHVTRAGMLGNLGRYEEGRAQLYESIRKFERMPMGPANSLILCTCYTTLADITIINYRKTRDAGMAPEYFEKANHYYNLNPFPIDGPAAIANIGSYANPVGHPPRAGEFDEYAGIIAKCISIAAPAIGGYLSGTDSLCRAELAFFKGDLNTAEQYARKAAAKAHEKGQYEVESKSLFYLHRIYLCAGNASAGTEIREQLEAQLEISGYINRYVIHDIITGWFYAHIGEMEHVAPWLRNESEESDLNLMFHNFETMVKAKSLFAEKRFTEALKFLERKDVREGLGSFHLGILEISVLEAAVRNRMGDEEGAIKTLEAAYKISLPNDLDMPFIEMGGDMRALAALALERGKCTISASWLEMIRKKASTYEKKLTLEIERRRGSLGDAGIPFLTSLELSILTGISRGYTREKIAADSSISINHVKNTIKSIYSKLGAYNSANAIRIAVKAGLIKNTR